MDFYEQLVMVYLQMDTADKEQHPICCRDMFVLPQAKILKDEKGNEWEAYPDFVAINFAEKTIYNIEVTKNWVLSGFIENRSEINRKTIEYYIRNEILKKQLSEDEYKLIWILFVREARVEWVRDKINDDPWCEVISLEHVLDGIKATLP